MNEGDLEYRQVLVGCPGRDGFAGFARGVVQRECAASRLITRPYVARYTIGFVDTMDAIVGDLERTVPYVLPLFEALTSL
jgi:hypothetical protein